MQRDLISLEVFSILVLFWFVFGGFFVLTFDTESFPGVKNVWECLVQMTADFAGQAESLRVSKYHTHHCTLVEF